MMDRRSFVTGTMTAAISSTPIAVAIAHDAVDRWVRDWVDKNIDQYLEVTDGPKDAITFNFRGKDFHRDALAAFNAEMK